MNYLRNLLRMHVYTLRMCLQMAILLLFKLFLLLCTCLCKNLQNILHEKAKQTTATVHQINTVVLIMLVTDKEF